MPEQVPDPEITWLSPKRERPKPTVPLSAAVRAVRDQIAGCYIQIGELESRLVGEGEMGHFHDVAQARECMKQTMSMFEGIFGRTVIAEEPTVVTLRYTGSGNWVADA